MNLEHWIAIISTILGVPALWITGNRVRVAAEMHELLVRTANRFWSEADEKRLANRDPIVKEVFNSFIEVAAIAPAIAAGIVSPARNSRPDRKSMKKFMTFLEENGWALAYVCTASLALRRLEFHGKPWRPDLAWRALQAAFFMKFFVDHDGVIEASLNPEHTASQINRADLGLLGKDFWLMLTNSQINSR